jgi:hypothetical protein
MNRRVWVLGAIVLGLLGCVSPQTRLQSEDDNDTDKEAEVKTIKDVTGLVANAEPIPVSGVGLVIGLDGTGGGSPPGTYRTMLEDHLRKRGVQNVKEVLASPTTSLVLVTGLIQPGAHRGDVFDVEITVPRESHTASLRGGRLVECVLYNYATKRGLDPKFAGPDATLLGQVVGKAEGNVIVGLGEGDEPSRLRQGHIWGGGRCLKDRPFFLVLNDDQQYARVVTAVADGINGTFQGAGRGPRTELAVAKTKAVVNLTVPAQYRLNQPRYLRVVRLIPLWETPQKRIAYRRRLEEQLMDPAKTLVAALRLEALGTDSETTLKGGLKSPHPLVRFASAEALAYLGCPACGEELARIVKEQPALRAFALTAMASLDEAVCHVELRRLMNDRSAETQYGAFRALRALDEHEEAVQGELCNETFWLHHVAPGAPELVHISTTRRAEIVVFGDEATLIPPFPLLAGEFTITAGKDDDKCTIKRTALRHSKPPQQCSLKLVDVIHTMADMGANYGDVVEMLKRADRLRCVSCRVAVDALPQATSVFDLAKAGAGDPEMLKTHPEILGAKADLGATPNLFDRGTAADSSAKDDTPSGRPGRKSKAARAELESQAIGSGLE